MLLHDEWGHPLLATTHRGDTHLTAGLPHMVEWYKRAAGRRSLRRLIVDREGMAAEFLADQTEAGRCVVTVLQASQYKGIESFTDLGEFVPLSWNLQGNPRARWQGLIAACPSRITPASGWGCAWRSCATCDGWFRMRQRVVRRITSPHPTRITPHGSTPSGPPHRRRQ